MTELHRRYARCCASATRPCSLILTFACSLRLLHTLPERAWRPMIFCSQVRHSLSDPTPYCCSVNSPCRAIDAGDDSSWNMSDWQWDANAFVAVPKLEQQSTSECCKRRKTLDVLESDRQPRPCGGCKAIQHGPLKYLQPEGDSAGSNSCEEPSEAKHEVLVSLPVQVVSA